MTKSFTLYQKMLLIRRVEEAIAENYPRKEMRCPVHLSIGQEAIAVGVCQALDDADRIYSNHRCHAHYLAKGGSLNAMLAELHGKATGCAKGKGGSMHLVDVDRGMMGASALVGGTIPLAAGSALAFSLAGDSRVGVSFFGDGASEEGIFYETLNFAALKNLPALFICENNLYATYSHQSKRQANTEIWRRAQAMGMEALRIDGNDVEQVFATSLVAVEKAKAGGGPTLIECLTYRFLDHVGPDLDLSMGYRSEAEWTDWSERCPLLLQKNRLLTLGGLSAEIEQNLEAEIRAEIDTAFAFARQSPLPEAKEIFTDIYANP